MQRHQSSFWPFPDRHERRRGSQSRARASGSEQSKTQRAVAKRFSSCSNRTGGSDSRASLKRRASGIPAPGVPTELQGVRQKRVRRVSRTLPHCGQYHRGESGWELNAPNPTCETRGISRAPPVCPHEIRWQLPTVTEPGALLASSPTVRNAPNLFRHHLLITERSQHE